MGRPHEVLDVPRDADEDAVRDAYRELMKEHHPDQGGSTEEFMQIKDAYESMLDDGGVTAPLTAGSGGTVTATRPGTSEGTSEGSERGTVVDDDLALEASADGLVVRLTALTERLPNAALLPDHVEDGRRVGACFRIQNEAPEPVTWRARRVRFVGSEGERYLPSVYRPKRTELPDRWRGDDVELAPGESARSFLLSRTMPEDVAVEAVVYDQRASRGPDRRVRFELDGCERAALDREPFQ